MAAVIYKLNKDSSVSRTEVLFVFFKKGEKKHI